MKVQVQVFFCDDINLVHMQSFAFSWNNQYLCGLSDPHFKPYTLWLKIQHFPALRVEENKYKTPCAVARITLSFCAERCWLKLMEGVWLIFTSFQTANSFHNTASPAATSQLTPWPKQVGLLKSLSASPSLILCHINVTGLVKDHTHLTGCGSMNTSFLFKSPTVLCCNVSPLVPA